jgi:hypothetical protein
MDSTGEAPTVVRVHAANYDFRDFRDATAWAVDTDGVLTVEGPSGVVAQFASGGWAMVERTSDAR